MYTQYKFERLCISSYGPLKSYVCRPLGFHTRSSQPDPFWIYITKSADQTLTSLLKTIIYLDKGRIEIMVFYPDMQKFGSFAEWETEADLHYAHQDAQTDEVKLSASQSSAEDEEFAFPKFELKDLEIELKEARKSCKEYDYYTITNPDRGPNRHITCNDQRGDQNDFQDQIMPAATFHPPQTTHYAHSIEDDFTTDLTSRKITAPEECHQIQKAKLRTEQAVKRKHFLRLHRSPPDSLPRGLQPKSEWELDQKALFHEHEATKHEQKRQANIARIHEKALNHKYRLRMTLVPPMPISKELADFGDRKSCFPAYPNAPGAKKQVRFDDVHEEEELYPIYLSEGAEKILRFDEMTGTEELIAVYVGDLPRLEYEYRDPL